MLSPSLVAPRLPERRDPHNPQRAIRVRARVLTLTVMVAIMVSLVWRRLGAIAEVCRVLAGEGLLWVQPCKVSEQAIGKRLDTLPAGVMREVFAEVSSRLQAQPALSGPGLAEWTAVRHHFSLIAVVAGSTLEALRKKTQALRAARGRVRAGRMMVMVDAFGQRPLRQCLLSLRPSCPAGRAGHVSRVFGDACPAVGAHQTSTPAARTTGVGRSLSWYQ